MAFTLTLSAVYSGLRSLTVFLQQTAGPDRLPVSCLCCAPGGEDPLSRKAGLDFLGIGSWSAPLLVSRGFIAMVQHSWVGISCVLVLVNSFFAVSAALLSRG